MGQYFTNCYKNTGNMRIIQGIAEKNTQWWNYEWQT